jgi:hypothetical protein
MKKLLSLCIAVAFLTTGIIRAEDADDILPEETGNAPMVQGEPGVPPAPIAGTETPGEMPPPPPSAAFTSSSTIPSANEGTIVAKKSKKKKKAKKAKKNAKKKNKKKKRR